MIIPFFQKLFKIGTEDKPSRLAACLELCNKSSLFMAAAALSVSLFFQQKGLLDASIAAFVESTLFIGCLIFNAVGAVYVSRIVFFLALNICTYLFSSSMGSASEIFLFYFAGLVGPFAFFTHKERLPLCFSVFHACFFFTLDLLVQYHPIQFFSMEAVTSEGLKFFIMPSAFLAALVMVVSLIRQNEQFQNSLQRQHQKLEAIVASLNDVVFEVSEDYRILDYWSSEDNPLPILKNNLKSQPYASDVISAELYQTFVTHSKKVMETGEPAHFEYQSTINQHWYEARIVPLRLDDDEQGACTRFSVSLRDISLTRAIRQQMLIQQQIVAKHWNGIIFSDLHGRVQFANEAAYRLFNTDAVRMDEMTLSQYDDPDGMSTRNILLEVKQEGIWRGDVILRRDDQSQFHCRLTVFKVSGEDDETLGLVWNCRDVSAEKESEHQLRLSERKFRSMAENAPGAIVEWAVDKQFTAWKFNYASPKIEEVFDVSFEQLSHDPYYIMNVLHPEDIEIFRRTMHAAVETLSRWDFTVRMRPPGREMRWIRAILTPIEWEGSLVVFHGILMDITAEQEYREGLVQAKESAEANTREKSDFLAVMSHEIRTPLNALIGLSHLMLQEDPLPYQIENLKTLKFSAEGLLSLINDILDFGKIDAGKINLESIPFSLTDLVEGVVSSMNYQSESKGVQLKKHIDKSIPTQLLGDPTRISQILNNLLSNALKFTHKGQVEVKMVLRHQLEGEATIECRVSDTGIGIPLEKQRKIFQVFSQADSSVTRQYGGTGLGLSITKRLLGLMGSEIYIKSREGEGSTFFFELILPVAPIENTANIEHLPEAPDLTGKRIMVVDDNRVNVMVASKLLKRWNAIIESAENGEEAYQKVQEAKYDLILMDIQMPVMDGYEATRAIRNLEGAHYQNIPIIALTATVQEEVEKRAREVGLDGILTKPIRPGDLKRRVCTFMDIRHDSGKKTDESDSAINVK